MNAAPQELLKEYVKSQHFTSTTEIMAAMKEMFRDVIQTAMEVELDEELGRERCQRAEASETAPNYRCQRQSEIVRKRRRNFVVFGRGGNKNQVLPCWKSVFTICCFWRINSLRSFRRLR